jgi:hypothetical protein
MRSLAAMIHNDTGRIGAPPSPSKYPRRGPYFAHRYCRLLTKTCAAQELGHAAFVLCVTIAHLEDAKRYAGPVTFFNEQLFPLIGVRKWESLDWARRRAVQVGWLHYEPGNRGLRQPGRYWVTTPPAFEHLDDSPCDESQYPANGDRKATQYPANGDQRGDQRGDQHGEQHGDQHGEHSTLTLSLNTSRPKTKFSDADLETAKWMFRLIRGLNPGYKEPNFDKWANSVRLMRERDKATDEEIRDLFQWANNDGFWRTNILCPDKLREQWDKLTTQKKYPRNGSASASGNGKPKEKLNYRN